MVEDGISYQTIVETMDICLGAGFPNISLSGSL
jgi:hypothetical protein